MGQATTTAEQLLAPTGELHQHRQAVQQLASQAEQNVALLEAMKLASSCVTAAS
jgi:hypothetical protein